MAGIIKTLKNAAGVITGYSYSNDYTDSAGNHNATTIYDANWQPVSSTLTTGTGTKITSSTWSTITTLGVVTHSETGYLTDGTTTNYWEYKFDANWQLTFKNFWQTADITKMTKVIVDGVVGYETTTNGTTSHYDSTGVLTSYRIAYSEVESATNTKTGTRTYDTNWKSLDDTWTNSKDGSIVSQKTLTDSLGVETCVQNGRNSTGTSTWEYHFDTKWNLIEGSAVDGILTTTYGPDFKIISQIGDITKMTAVTINGVALLETIAIDAITNKQIETLYTTKGVLTGYRINDDKIAGGKFYPGTLTFDPTWKIILNKTWTNSDGSIVSEDNNTDVQGIVTHVQKGRDSTGKYTWEYHFDANWILINGTSYDGLITTTFGEKFTVISQIADTSKLTPVTDALGVITGYEMMDNDTTMSFFDAKGTPTGHRTLATTVDSKGILSTTMTNFDANWKMVGSTWERSDGTAGKTEITTDSQGNLVTIETGRKADNTGTMNWVYNFDAAWHFLGGRIYDAVTKKMTMYDENWVGTVMTPLHNDPAHPDLVTGYRLTDTTELQTTTYYDLNVNPTGYSQPYAASEIVNNITGGTRTYNADWKLVLDNIQFTNTDGTSVSQDTHYTDGKITSYEQIIHSGIVDIDIHFDANWGVVSITRTTDITQMTAIKDSTGNILEYQKIDTAKGETVHSDPAGVLKGFSVITETITDPINSNITIKETNFASDRATPTGYEEISHNSSRTSYWDVVFDTGRNYDGMWVDNGLKTTAFDEHNEQLQEILNVPGNPEAAHLVALMLIGIAALAHDQVV